LGVAPNEAVFVDDTLGHVNAAQALGIRGIHFTTAQALAGELGELLALA
jgi:FMN phosphatase YigB (HAD superfamily)